MKDPDEYGSTRAHRAQANGSDRKPGVLSRTFGGIGCLGLLVVLAPLALFTLYVVFVAWQSFAIFAGAIALAVILHLLRVWPGAFYLVGIAATLMAWILALVLSGWDTEGRLDDDKEPFVEVLVFWLSIGGGILAFVFGLAAAIRARGWVGRYGGIAIAIACGLAVSGVLFL